MLLYMYTAPGLGQTPWGQMLMSTESPYHFAHLLQVLKLLLKYDFKHILNDFIHVYSPRARAENPLWTNIWRPQKALITSTICCKFQTNLLEFWFYTHFLMFFHMYIAPGWDRQPFVTKILMSTEKPCHFAHLLQVSKKYLWSLILYIIFHVFKHVYCPGAGADNPLESEFLCKHKLFVTLVICCKFLPLNDFLTEPEREPALMQKACLYSFYCSSLVISIFKKVNCRR